MLNFFSAYVVYIVKFNWIIIPEPPPVSYELFVVYNQDSETIEITSLADQVVYLSIIGMDGKISKINEPIELVTGVNNYPLKINTSTSVGLYTITLEDQYSNTTSIKIPRVK